MKSTKLFAATLSIAAIGVSSLFCNAANAQGTVVTNSPATDKPVVVVTPMASPMDRYMASWIYTNMDARQVVSFEALGYSEWELRAASNIAVRANLDVDYVLRRHRDTGTTMYDLASEFGIDKRYVDRDIPGFGAGGMSIPSKSGMMAATSMLLPPPVATTPATETTTAENPAPEAAAPIAQGSVVDAINSNPSLSTLAAAIKAAGLTDTLNGSGPFTIFAPSNDAFAKLPAGTVNDWMKPENQDKLRAALTYHVIPGKVMAADVMAMSNPSTPATVNGATLSIKTTAPVTVNGANVTQTDIVASNGVIHIIDTVLMPPAANIAPAASTPAPAADPTTPAPAPGPTPINPNPPAPPAPALP